MEWIRVERCLQCESHYREYLMTYFEKSLADTAKRKGNGFIIKADPKKVEHNYRLPLLPEIETS